MNNSRARTGHQRGMGGRGTDDDDTHERHTDTNKLTRHTASWLPHTLSWRTHNSGPHSSCRPPQHSKVPRETNKGTTSQQTTGVTCEARAACSTSSNLAVPRGTDETVCGVYPLSHGVGVAGCRAYGVAATFLPQKGGAVPESEKRRAAWRTTEPSHTCLRLLLRLSLIHISEPTRPY